MSAMQKAAHQVWIGVAQVVPRDGCDLLAADKGAFVNFLTLAASESEYRAKLDGALGHYRLERLGLEDVGPLSEADRPARDIISIAEQLEQSGNPNHVRYGTFHTYPRVM